MALSDSVWESWLDRLYNLRRDKSGSHERPHKPIFILSIIHLLDRGLITGNEVPLSDDLIGTFKHFFAVVRRENDQPTIQNPFFHLCGDKFWHLVPIADEREIEGQRELVAIAGKSVIPPSEEKFYPALESLRWRKEHLATTY